MLSMLPSQRHSLNCRILTLSVAFVAVVSAGGSKNGTKHSDAVTPQPQSDAVPNETLLTGVTATCQLKTASQWQDFIKHNAADERWAPTCEDSECDEAFVSYVAQTVQKTFTDCADVVAKNPRIAACSDHLRRFTPAWLRQHDETTYGFIPDNHTYLTSEVAADKPSGMMTVPPELLAALPSRSALEAAARANGWKYLTHDSALGTARTFVYIPDAQGRFDRWMLFNLNDDPNSFSLGIPLSMITVLKKDASGKPLAKVRLNFRDYTIEQDGTKFSLSLPEDRNGKCYSCHSSGMRRLIDRRTPITASAPVKGEPGYDPTSAQPTPADFGYTRLTELNKIINAYGLPDWSGMIVPEDHGPALGAKQGCTSCHNGKYRGILTISTSTAQLTQKVAKQLSMPPPPDRSTFALLEKNELQPATMSTDDRITLQSMQNAHDDVLTDFDADRMPSLTAWLQQESCVGHE